MNLRDTWRNCDNMWEWIAENWTEGDDVDDMKEEWFLANNFAPNHSNCFFCFFSETVGCTGCPGQLVDSTFHCINGDGYHYIINPVAFYKKIHALYQIAKEKYGWEDEEV